MLACKMRKWGNSLGVVIPKDKAKELRVRAGEEVWIDIQKKENPLKELWGALPKLKNSRELLKEIRQEESKYL